MCIENRCGRGGSLRLYTVVGRSVFPFGYQVRQEPVVLSASNDYCDATFNLLGGRGAGYLRFLMRYDQRRYTYVHMDAAYVVCILVVRAVGKSTKCLEVVSRTFSTVAFLGHLLTAS